MARQKQDRQVGDTLTAIAGTLTRPSGTVTDLTGKTVTFKMLDSEGATKVAETGVGVTVTDATAGEVQYSPLDADVDEEGTFYAYFLVDSGGDQDSYPVEKGGFAIHIQAAT